MQSKKIKFIDLFCGIGGFRIAFEKFRCKCVYSSDIDIYACKTYERNFNEYPYSDIKKVNPVEIPDFDVLCGGFPCQPFSIAGKRLGFNDTRGTLFFDIVRIIKAKRPKAFLLENVKGIVNHDKGKTIKVIEEVLSKLGYTYEWKILNAKNYGVPQNRERWYCVGFKRGVVSKDFRFQWPSESRRKSSLKDIIGNCHDESYLVSSTCKKNIKQGLVRKHIVPHKTTLAYEIRASRCQFANEGVSPCLTAKMGTGGNNVPVIVSQGRRLTERECLSIMGFPKAFKIDRGHQAYKQIGNSVAVPVVAKIAGEMIKVLGE